MAEHVLGVYFAPTHHRDSDLDYIEKLEPSVVRLLDPDVAQIDTVLELVPNAEIWFRNWLLDDNNGKRHQEMLADPVGSAQRHAADWQRWLGQKERESTQRGLRWPARDKQLISSINEPNSYAHGAQVRDYTGAWLQACTGYGSRATGLNFPVGHPGKAIHNDPYDWAYFAQLEGDFKAGNHVINLHEYCRKDGPLNNDDWGNLMGRHLECPMDVPIYIGEWGVEGHIYNEYPAGTGWLYFNIPAATYADWLVTYKQRMGAKVQVICPFITDYRANQWATLDTNPAHPDFLLRLPHLVKEPGPPPTPPPPSGNLTWPVKGHITQQFNENPQNYFGHPGHMGLDFGAPMGTDVKAVYDGRVAWVDADSGYGKYIRVWHPELQVHTFYAHLSEQLVVKGQSVTGGQVIGHVGNTGNSTGPHLHLEVRIADESGNYVDPGNGHGRGRIDPLSAYKAWERVL